MFRKILISNRGEIACRVIRTAQRLGINTVAVYSDADAQAPHVRLADEAVHIGASPPAESYLVAQRIVDAAVRTGARAIHPGYGFLSENAAFSELCKANGLVFIGPPAQAIEVMGSKSAAKRVMEEAGVPLLSGYHGAAQDVEQLRRAATEVGYPVLLKAVAGGGGKGMRQVHAAAEFDEALQAAKREALSSFGNDDMLVEKYLEAPRHVEVQVFCDHHGNGVYLFERDCSVQRRHQKIIEEAPAPHLSDALRTQMGEAALRAAQAVSYVGAGTVEFLLDASGDFFFMEMNTRLQVEHPVTEMITGVDLVEWQLLVADGADLPKTQRELASYGHSFEARIYAEDPHNDFLPAAGRLEWLQAPTESEYVRVDSGVVQGDEVGVYYDPMIAKLITWGENREQALARLVQALGQYRICGVTTNVAFLRRLASHAAFRAGEVETGFIAKHADALFADDDPVPALLAASLYQLLRRQLDEVDRSSPWTSDGWRLNASAAQAISLTVGQDVFDIATQRLDDGFVMSLEGSEYRVAGRLDGDALAVVIDGHRQTYVAVAHGASLTLFGATNTLTVMPTPVDLGDDVATSAGDFRAPMNGTVLEVLVQPGDAVAAGATILIMEAMKMEHAIKAPTDGTVNDVYFAAGELVDGGAVLVSFEPAAQA